MVFQTVVLSKLLMDGCQLRQGGKIIVLESDYCSTKMHAKSSSNGAGTVGILAGFLS